MVRSKPVGDGLSAAAALLARATAAFVTAPSALAVRKRGRCAHPGGKLHTTAKTCPFPVPSGAIGIGVSQFVKEPHT